MGRNKFQQYGMGSILLLCFFFLGKSLLAQMVSGEMGNLPVYYLPQESYPPSYSEMTLSDPVFYDSAYPVADTLPGLPAPIPQATFDDAQTVTMHDQWGEDSSGIYHFQLLPEGELYPSYLAGRKEPRLQSLFNYDKDYGWIWDIALGGRVPLLRYGTEDPIHPEGLQIDMEGAALLRLDIERNQQLTSTDYRAGLPITYGIDQWQFKTGYYHVSSHLGDQYLLDGFREKKHYVRNSIMMGIAYRPIDSVRLYGEGDWSFYSGTETKAWEFQFGAEYSPVFDEANKMVGAPFAAIHTHLFQEIDFGGYLNLQAGWQWRKKDNGLFRLGLEYYNGHDDQFQFQYINQQKFGVGFWYDF